MASSFDFDLFVIGGGSGGVRAARMAAQRGASVALAETLGTDGLGGTCVNVGCIPKKLYSYAAHYADGFEESHGFGWEGERPSLNWGTLKANRAKEISRLNGVYSGLLTGSGVTVLNGFARLEGEHAITLATLNADGSPGHQRFTAKNVLIATGGHFRAAFQRARTRDHVQRGLRSRSVSQPLSGGRGGYIACEFASIFNGLGAQVTQLYRGEQVLRGFDTEIRHFVAGEMRKSGVDLRLNADVVDVRKAADGRMWSARAATWWWSMRCFTPPVACPMCRAWGWRRWVWPKVARAR
ncbi:MAG: FAD-dependent oxidoreductase [Burkholderiaceae bacterium]